MYRVFESLDALVQTVEGAYGVPMSSNCLVPRNETLGLLDELRNALPMELDDAQDVLDKQDEVLAAASQEADTMVNNARAEADETIESANQHAATVMEDAENRANTTVAQAQEEADKLVSSAAARAEDMIARATAEAERLSVQAKQAYDRSVNEGIAERERLVSESEVVAAANDEARRIVEKAHADSNALRNECDQFVDSKLAEFEETLSATLRVVTRDRSALRRGAGASGAAAPTVAPARPAASEYRGASPTRYSTTGSDYRERGGFKRSERSERSERSDG